MAFVLRKFPILISMCSSALPYQNLHYCRKKQFSSKIAEWDFKKNTNKKERRELLQTLRPTEEETLVDSMGREHKRQKIERWENDIKKEGFVNSQHRNLEVVKGKECGCKVESIEVD
jgi:hypothetical protein